MQINFHDPKTVRQKLGWTQTEMADFLRLDQSSVSRMETRGIVSGPVSLILDIIATELPN